MSLKRTRLQCKLEAAAAEARAEQATQVAQRRAGGDDGSRKARRTSAAAPRQHEGGAPPFAAAAMPAMPAHACSANELVGVVLPRSLLTAILSSPLPHVRRAVQDFYVASEGVLYTVAAAPSGATRRLKCVQVAATAVAAGTTHLRLDDVDEVTSQAAAALEQCVTAAQAFGLLRRRAALDAAFSLDPSFATADVHGGELWGSVRRHAVSVMMRRETDGGTALEYLVNGTAVRWCERALPGDGCIAATATRWLRRTLASSDDRAHEALTLGVALQGVVNVMTGRCVQEEATALAVVDLTQLSCVWTPSSAALTAAVPFSLPSTSLPAAVKAGILPLWLARLLPIYVPAYVPLTAREAAVAAETRKLPLASAGPLAVFPRAIAATLKALTLAASPRRDAANHKRAFQRARTTVPAAGAAAAAAARTAYIAKVILCLHGMREDGSVFVHVVPRALETQHAMWVVPPKAVVKLVGVYLLGTNDTYAAAAASATMPRAAQVLWTDYAAARIFEEDDIAALMA